MDKLNLKKLYLIDPWKHQPQFEEAWYSKGKQSTYNNMYEGVKSLFGNEIESGKVIIIRETSEDAYIQIEEEVDWIYIDGNHRYEFVKKDLELYSKKVKSGGYIIGDDYIDGKWWRDQIKKAVDEFIDDGENNIELIKIESNQFILKKC